MNKYNLINLNEFQSETEFKKTFLDIVKNNLVDLKGSEIDKNILKNVLSNNFSSDLLDEKLHFKVLKNLNIHGKHCIGWVCLDDYHVTIDLEEIKNENKIKYMLSSI